MARSVATLGAIKGRRGGRKVLMALVGGADELAEALSRARVTAA